MKRANDDAKNSKPESPGPYPNPSSPIFHTGLFTGMNKIISKMPIRCLGSTNIGAHTLFSSTEFKHLRNRIGLEIPYARLARAPVVKGLSQEVSNLLSRVQIPAGAPLETLHVKH